MKNTYSTILKKEINLTIDVLHQINADQFFNFEKICLYCINSIKKNNKIIFFGNGGSAADAQHLASELIGRYKLNRKALPAISLATDTSAITAIGNDLNFKYIFSRQIEAMGNKGDIAIALTTSGNSKNLIEAIKIAKKKKLICICFSGNNGGQLSKYTDISIIINSKNTSVIQSAQIVIGHALCEIIEKYFYKKN